MFEVSFVDGRFTQSLTVDAETREEAQEHAIEFWEAQGIVHSDLRIVRKTRNLTPPY